MKDQERIALDEEKKARKLKTVLKQDALWLLILGMAALVALKILFYNESLVVIARLAASILWLFVLPGLSIMYYWHDIFEFAERLIIAVPLSTALVAIPSYYLGLLGLPIAYHGILLPSLVIIAAGIILYREF